MSNQISFIYLFLWNATLNIQSEGIMRNTGTLENSNYLFPCNKVLFFESKLILLYFCFFSDYLNSNLTCLISRFLHFHSSLHREKQKTKPHLSLKKEYKMENCPWQQTTNKIRDMEKRVGNGEKERLFKKML
jgi:hypothetical protein